jgi:hypothetical protein
MKDWLSIYAIDAGHVAAAATDNAPGPFFDTVSGAFAEWLVTDLTVISIGCR